MKGILAAASFKRLLRGNASGLSRALNDHSGAVAQDFRGRPSPADFRAFIANADYGIRAQFSSVLKQKVIRLLSGLLAHLSISANLSANDLLEAAQKALA